MFINPEDYEKLCGLLGYTFKKVSLLQQAITRKSGLLEGKQEEAVGHNERLEFLGDSILRMTIDDILIFLNPNDNEGQLSQKRDDLVSKDGFLSLFAESIKLDQFIILGKGEKNNLYGSGKKKILNDVMEAIIAAIFLDCDKNYKIIFNFVSEISGLARKISLQRDLNLYRAVSNGDLQQVNHWLAQGANPATIHDDEAYKISCPCCLRGQLLPMWTEVRSFVRRSNALDRAIRELNGFTKNTIAIVKALLKHGADPNNLGTFDYALLHETIIYYPTRHDNAAENFNLICELLCEYGADVNLRSKAIHCGYSSKNTLGFTPLELAIMLHDYKKLKILLRFGADPNLIDEEGRTSLHFAAIYADVYIKTNQEMATHSQFFQSKTPNYLELFQRIIRKLIEYGADIETADHYGNKAADLTANKILKRTLSSVAKSLTGSIDDLTFDSIDNTSSTTNSTCTVQ